MILKFRKNEEKKEICIVQHCHIYKAMPQYRGQALRVSSMAATASRVADERGDETTAYNEFQVKQRATVLSAERIEESTRDGRLRKSQMQFAQDTRRFFSTNTSGFVWHFCGAGKSCYISMIALGLLPPPPQTVTTTTATTRLLVLVPSRAALENIMTYLKPATNAMQSSFMVQQLSVSEQDASLLAAHVHVYRPPPTRRKRNSTAPIEDATEGDEEEEQGSDADASQEDFLGEKMKDAWVVVGTQQSVVKNLLPLLRSSQRGEVESNPPQLPFTHVCIDEGDYGTLQTGHSGKLPWFELREIFEQSGAIVILFSATRDRNDGKMLPEPYSVYTYRQLLQDGVVKKIKVTHLIPSGGNILHTYENPLLTFLLHS